MRQQNAQIVIIKPQRVKLKILTAIIETQKGDIQSHRIKLKNINGDNRNPKGRYTISTDKTKKYMR